MNTKSQNGKLIEKDITPEKMNHRFIDLCLRRGAALLVKAEDCSDGLRDPVGKPAISDRNPAQIKRATRYAKAIDDLRNRAEELGVRLAWDEVTDKLDLGRLEHDILMVLLAARADGTPAITGRELLFSVGTKPEQRLGVTLALENSAPLIHEGLIVVDEDDDLETRYHSISASFVADVSECPALGNKRRETISRRPPNEACRTYYEYLELLARYAESLLRSNHESHVEGLHSGKSLLFKTFPPRKARNILRRRQRSIINTSQTLHERVEAERTSGRWGTFPLALITAEQGLSESEKLLFVYTALRGSTLPDEDGPFCRHMTNSEDFGGLSGRILIDLLSKGDAERLDARRALYESSPLRARGLLEARGGRQGAAETMRFGVSEVWLRRLLGHSDLDDEINPKRGQARRSRLYRVVEPKVTLDEVVLSKTTREAIDGVIALRRDDVQSTFDLDTRFGIDGAVMMFVGPSGTGKTLTAEATAHALEQKLHVVDVPSLLSKWVGDTQKHIAAVFRHAATEEGGTVLFFDEADSLFYERDNTMRSWEVQDVNVLLTELERHNGVVILATNRKDALDRALVRRVSVTVDFPKPDLAEREALWLLHLPSKEHLSTDVNLNDLAQAADLTGGEISKAVAEAIRRVSLRGLERLEQEVLVEAVRTVVDGRFGAECGRAVGF